MNSYLGPNAALILCVVLLGSLVAAHLAGQGKADAWAWGILGPFGWVVAAILGANARTVAAIAALRPAPSKPVETTTALVNNCPACKSPVEFGSDKLNKAVRCDGCGSSNVFTAGRRPGGVGGPATERTLHEIAGTLTVISGQVNEILARPGS